MKKKFHPASFAIPNLTLGLVVLTAIVNGLDLILRGGSPGFSFSMLFGPDWWNVLLFPFRITDSWFSLAIYLYVFYMFGTQLDGEMGAGRFNLYIFTGILFVLFGTAFAAMSANFVYLSVFLAIAHLAPEMQILFFFVIPMKMRWLALMTAGLVLYGPIMGSLDSGSLEPLLGPLLGFANYLIFFAIPSLLRRIGPKRSRTFKHQAGKRITVHSCTVCGMTEADDPAMDFRYCVHCDDHEYCTRHLSHHTHIKAAASD